MAPTRCLAFTAFVLALVAAGCGNREGSAGAASTGAQLYASQNCTTCHKTDGSGNAFGPGLQQAGEFWTRESLSAYLADPVGTVAKDPRLTALSRNYSMKMPPVRGLSEEQRLQLADHVLGFGAPAAAK